MRKKREVTILHIRSKQGIYQLLAYPHCGEYFLEYRFVSVQIIAKRWKHSQLIPWKHTKNLELLTMKERSQIMLLTMSVSKICIITCLC